MLVVKKPLDFETLRNFTIGLRAQDQGTPPLHNDTTLAVEVLDADDQNPKFTHEHYTAILPDDAQPVSDPSNPSVHSTMSFVIFFLNNSNNNRFNQQIDTYVTMC